MGEQIRSEAISQSAGSDPQKIMLGPAYFMNPVAETIVMPEPNFEEKKHLYSDKPLRFRTAPTIQDIEAVEEQIDLKDAIKSLNEPGSIRLADFKKKLGI
jgi:hypothetical protein